jgi:hypothetical protein
MVRLVCNLLFTIAVMLVNSAIVRARDPVQMSLAQLAEKSDIVVIGRIENATPSNQYADLNKKLFDEFSVRIKILSNLKGEVKRGDVITVITYKNNGKGMPGNFGSVMKITDSDDKQLHMLYLRKREETWMPTSGYLDGGNSHFIIESSGYTE